MVRADTLLYDAKRTGHGPADDDGGRPSQPYEAAVRA
jgi:hypothetical protein